MGNVHDWMKDRKGSAGSATNSLLVDKLLKRKRFEKRALKTV